MARVTAIEHLRSHRPARRSLVVTEKQHPLNPRGACSPPRCAWRRWPAGPACIEQKSARNVRHDPGSGKVVALPAVPHFLFVTIGGMLRAL